MPAGSAAPATRTRSSGNSLSLGPDDRLLGGGGTLVRRALQSGCSAAGLVHSRGLARLARARAGVRVEHAEADAMPFADGELTATSCLVAQP